jgi:hypothetical protein
MQASEYGSEDFLRACRFAALCGEVKGRGPRSAVARLRAGQAQLAWYRMQLPATEVRLTSAPGGRMIAEHFGIRHEGRWRYRGAQGVLQLPDDFGQYMRGRSRQAVRTNVGHARRAGLTPISMAIDGWAPGVGDERRPFIAPGPIERWTVVDGDGIIQADSILSVDAEVALLQGLVSFVEHARWLLHTAIVERLCGSCGLLLVNTENVYLMGSGQQYFQKLLGYKISRLRLRPSLLPVSTEPVQPAGAVWPPAGACWRGPDGVEA